MLHGAVAILPKMNLSSGNVDIMSSATMRITPQEQADSINFKIAQDNGLEILEEPRQLLEVASDEGRELGAQPGGSAVSEVGPVSGNVIITFLWLVFCIGPMLKRLGTILARNPVIQRPITFDETVGKAERRPMSQLGQFALGSECCSQSPVASSCYQMFDYRCVSTQLTVGGSCVLLPGSVTVCCNLWHHSTHYLRTTFESLSPHFWVHV